MADIIHIPELYQDFIRHEKRFMPQNDHVINLDHSQLTVSQQNALEDFETFKYLMDNAYAGRDYWAMHGVNFHACYAQIENQIKAQAYIHASKLRELFYQAFAGKIVDNHLGLGVITERKRSVFSAHKYAYFTGITVEKQDNQYIVVQSETDNALAGDRIECEESQLYPTLSPGEREWFYVGIRSWVPVENISIGLNGKAVTLPVHKSRAGDYVSAGEQHFKYTRCHDVPVVLSETFDAFGDVPRECGAELGHQLQAEKELLWVLADNGGGSSDYAMHFIEALNGYANNATHVAWLRTHITDFTSVQLDKPYTEWKFSLDDPVDYTQSKYNGTLYTLMNTRTGSSAENAVGYAKSVKNHLLIGENSGGIGLFGEVQGYILRHSLIRLGIPCKIFLNGVAEGEGYTPDYWVDSADLVNTVAHWVKNNR